MDHKIRSSRNNGIEIKTKAPRFTFAGLFYGKEITIENVFGQKNTALQKRRFQRAVSSSKLDIGESLSAFYKPSVKIMQTNNFVNILQKNSIFFVDFLPNFVLFVLYYCTYAEREAFFSKTGLLNLWDFYLFDNPVGNESQKSVFVKSGSHNQHAGG